MPLVKEPHFCQPPVWPWLFRVDTVWKCGRCGAFYRLAKRKYPYSGKYWERLESTAK